METETVSMSKRVCRYCRGEYRWPIGSRAHACPLCAPTLFDEGVQLALDDDEREWSEWFGTLELPR